MKLIVTATLLCSTAFSAAFYSSTVLSDFMLGGAIVVKGPELPGAAFTPGAFATSAGLVSDDGVLPAARIVAAAGATPVAAGFATSSYLTGHIFRIDNSLGFEPLLAAFTFRFSWDIDLGVTNLAADRASAGAFFHITGIDNELLLIDGVPVAEFLLNPVYDTAFGSIGGTDSGLTSGAILVPAGTVSVFSVITDTNGFAVSVPEPDSVWLVAPLLGGLAAFRRLG